MKVPKITVAIPTYQREEVLVNTIEDVLDQTFDGFELIVVDQTEDHTEKIRALLERITDERFRYFKVSPPSLPAARNFAIKKSRSDIILFIDDDVQLAENFIAAHYNIHISQADIKAVAGRIQTEGEETAEKLFCFNWYGDERYSFNYPHPQEATAFQGCNFSVKKEVLESVGFFDTNYMGNAMREESDLAFRIKKAGYKIWYTPNACLTHLMGHPGGCSILGLHKDNLSFYKNDLYYTLKTVHFFMLPAVLAAKTYRYILKRPISRILPRGYLFFRGLTYAFSRRFFPRKIAPTVLEKRIGG